MDWLLELIGEFLLDGAVSVFENKKISKWIRYPILILLLSIFICVIVFSCLLTITLIKNDNILAAIFIFALALFFIVGLILQIIKYRKKSK